MINKSLLFMLEKASRDKPVTRQEIRATFHVSDRVARHMVEKLRDQGYPVVGISDQEGYWIAKSRRELDMFVKNYTAKARTIERRTRKMCKKFYEQYQERMM